MTPPPSQPSSRRTKPGNRRRGASRGGRGVARLRGTTHVRLRVSLVIIAMMLSVFGVRLIQLQGLDSGSYAAMANASGLVTIDLPAKRGEILDRNGQPLAESVAGLMIVADPTRTNSHAEQIAKILADRLGLDYFDTLSKLTKHNDTTRFVYVARRVPSTLATTAMAQIDKLGYVGVDTAPDPVRVYPAGDVAANLVGYVGSQGTALSGLELNFNHLLSGKDGKETYEVGGGNRIPLGDNSEVKPVNGKDLHLTIDRDVQWFSQRVLCQAVQKAKAISGSAVVMDSRTGELIAFADCPTFDPTTPDENQKYLVSGGLSDAYEPGSVEKVFTASSLIDAGKLTPRTRFLIPPQLHVLDRTINDYFVHGTIKLTLGGIIARSSNIGASMAATQFTPAQLHDYLVKFGLGSIDPIGMPGETQGILPPAATWSILTRAQISFGQGLSVNALQMATGVNTLANGGERVTPSLIQGSATTDGGTTVGTATTTRTRVVSQAAASATSQMMELVVTQGVGTAPQAGIPGYRVAGKTGTAQQAGAKCKCYDGSTDVSFAGFAPADQPRFTVYVVIKHPLAGSAGGSTAGPVFRQILNYVLQKYAVPPTDTTPSQIPATWGRNPGL